MKCCYFHGGVFQIRGPGKNLGLENNRPAILYFLSSLSSSCIKWVGHVRRHMIYSYLIIHICCKGRKEGQKVYLLLVTVERSQIMEATSICGIW